MEVVTIEKYQITRVKCVVKVIRDNDLIINRRFTRMKDAYKYFDLMKAIASFLAES